MRTSRVVVLATLFLIGLSACGGAGKQSSTGPLDLGEEASPKGLKVTYVEYRKGIPNADPAPEVADRVDAVLVRVCSTGLKKAELSLATDPVNFHLIDSDGGSYGYVAWDVASLPLFPYGKKLRNGDCVKGWVAFEVPANARITKATYVIGLDSMSAEWSI
jgi:hypothetical protein